MTSHFPIKLDFEDKDYDVNVSVIYHDEKNYGADADGRRGVPRRFIDDVIIRGVIDSDGFLVAPSQKMIERINFIAGEKLE